MGEVRSRCKSELGHDVNRWTGRPGAARSYRSRANRSRAGLVWTVALLLPATMAAKAAASQDQPPKVEAPEGRASAATRGITAAAGTTPARRPEA